MAYSIRRNGIKIEVTIKDDDFKVIDIWKFNKNEAAKYGKILKQKYGIDFTDKEKDLTWLE